MLVHGQLWRRTIREFIHLVRNRSFAEANSGLNRYDGVPAVADYHTLTEILREEWGYDYFVMTDAGGSDRLCNAFKMCQSDPIDMESVTEQLMTAGIDVEMGGGSL